MRFSSMAVSVLAQSVPLLAVGHLAGWKTREERSRLQRRRLRDALLVGVHPKKGMLFEKRVGVDGKHDDVLEKLRAGSARLEHDGASRDDPSDDRESSIQCDPLSKVTDSGIYGCGIDGHCVESEESEMGGFCVASKQASSISRALEEELPTCDPGPDEYETTCDCSQFNNTANVGNFTCTGKLCEGTTCVGIAYTAMYNADGSYYVEGCIDYSGVTGSPLESSCYSLSSDLTSTKCGIKINDVSCSSCEFEDETCPATISPGEECCTIFDCTNVVPTLQGNTCDLASGDQPTVASPSQTPPPSNSALQTAAPNASPPELLSPNTSSGSSHAAQAAIVVSAAAAAWITSFGT